MKHATLFFLLLVAVAGCKKKTADPPTRSFYMGVTPWPGDFTVTEANKAYNFINNNCDMVSQHVDEGIPYEEAYNNTGWPAGLIADIDTRKTKTAAGKKILLSSSALALTRKANTTWQSWMQRTKVE